MPFISKPLSTSFTNRTAVGMSRGEYTTGTRFFARVLKVVLDESDDNWQELGASQAQYGIYFSRPGETDFLEPSIHNFAYCGNSTLRQIPIENELVLIESRISIDYKNAAAGNTYTGKLYWVSLVPIWNHPHLNAYPDVILDGNGDVNTGKYFQENSKINPLQLVPGDVSIESRHGSSIRFGGTEYDSAEITKGHNGEPYMIIRNGQGEEKQSGDKTIYEDVNKDKASIYLTSNHTVPLKQARNKFSSVKTSEIPENTDTYVGAQILLNSDRIVLNAKDRDIVISSKEGTNVTAEHITVDGKRYLAFDADKIYLGAGSQNEKEPALLGDKTVELLDDILTQLNKLSTEIGRTVHPSMLSALACSAVYISTEVATIKKRLSKLLSKKVFVE